MAWRQGQHVTIVGMTGSGKTTLARTLLDRRTWRIMLVTKADDLTWRGWRTVSRVDQIRHQPAERPGEQDRGTSWRLYPRGADATAQYRAAFGKAWTEGDWCLYVDEAFHIEHMGLKRQLEQLLTQGRSEKVSVVCGVQRPSWVSRFVFSEATHIFSFQMGDGRDLKAIRDGVSDAFAEAVRGLGQYEFVYYHKITRRMITGTVRTLDSVLAA